MSVTQNRSTRRVINTGRRRHLAIQPITRPTGRSRLLALQRPMPSRWSLLAVLLVLTVSPSLTNASVAPPPPPPAAAAAPGGGGASSPQAQPVLDTYPPNEYEYSLRRDALLEAEKKFTKQQLPDLSADEQTVDNYLNYLKWREFRATKLSGFPPSRPIEEQLVHIQKTEIYAALKTLPKGGNMHSHENHELSKKILFDIVWASEDFQYLYLKSPNDTVDGWKMDFYNPPPVNNTYPWIKVQGSNYTKETILPHQTMLGLLTDNATRYPTDSGLRWAAINPLWSRCSDNLISNKAIKSNYLQAMYEHGFQEGVIYFESRKCFCNAERMYWIDSTVPPPAGLVNGKHYLEETWQGASEADIDITVAAIDNMTKIHPEFVGHRRISYSFRQLDFETWLEEMNNTVRLYQKYPEHVIGYDIVGEEDAGFSHLYYLQNFLKMYNSTTQQPQIPLYMHSSETNWPTDLIASNLDLDPVSTLQNAYEVMLLGTRRIGHGTGFIKHPYLLEVIRQRGIAMEICLVSNQMLGFTADLRNHPGLHYYRSGIPIIFGADDPGTFGYDNFTVDWYEAYMGWGLNLADLKQIAINSLNYSAMNAAEKVDAIENHWRPMWGRYITAQRAVACARNYTADGLQDGRSPSFARLLPRSGVRTGGTKVHVFGRNFERAICHESTLTCQFGQTNTTQAIYISSDHIICLAPNIGVTSGNEQTVTVSILLDNTQWIPTNLNFTYMYDVITTLPPVTSTQTSTASRDGMFASSSSSSFIQTIISLTSLVIAFALHRDTL